MEFEQGSVENCLPCDINHFNDKKGQIGCFECGGEAVQPLPGQGTCLCLGAGRDFQVRSRKKERRSRKKERKKKRMKKKRKSDRKNNLRKKGGKKIHDQLKIAN